ncbi:hypothetical protein BDZ94DRAFT_1307629 [Collybia nuda]|uniref:Protein kinase domain-containing protein n=1 Tax=Collybia nuda TaxID=64659 RepID=A0A9P6CLH9_9AGAR|nr:hypothetical protein BDZ94DRAFT_1307629 [Collybia nuda]
MQRFSHEQILDEIRSIFDWNPPLISPDPSSSPKRFVPSCFYYNHLDHKLSLRKTTPIPALTHHLSTTVDRVLEDIREHEIILSPVLVGDLFLSANDCKTGTYHDPVIDAYSVSKAYRNLTSYPCGVIASMLFLSPKSPTWQPLIKWNETEPGGKVNPGLNETHTLYMVRYDIEDDHVWSSVEDTTLATLQRAIRQYPVFALWEVLSITPGNEVLLKVLGESAVTVPQEGNVVTDYIPSTIDLLQRPDGMALPWGTPMSSLSEGFPGSIILDPPKSERTSPPPRRNSRSQTKVVEGVIGRSGTWATQSDHCSEEYPRTVTLPRRAESRESLLEVMLKHAWLRAVYRDSTFIIFHCGTLERIALRHRGTQTLYISDLIDVAHCKNPGYGKLHIGLYMAIMYDVLDRTQQRPEEEPITLNRKRRRGDSPSDLKSKRPRTMGLVEKLEVDELEHEKTCSYFESGATHCNLLLLRMQYGVYNSPSPSYFLRSGRLQSDNTVPLGLVHEATLKYLADGGKVCSMSVVVKFSLEPDRQKRLRHEYTIYEHLASSHVKGVPHVIGLFEDHNSDMLALVMTHAGTCLSSLYPGKMQFVVEEPQRSAFLRAMSNVHTAGIRHRDIRPENLTVDDEGTVFIIDFDMAEMSPTEGARSRELNHMTERLNGNYYPPNEFPIEHTNPRSTSTSRSTTSSSGSSIEQK